MDNLDEVKEALPKSEESASVPPAGQQSEANTATQSQEQEQKGEEGGSQPPDETMSVDSDSSSDEEDDWRKSMWGGWKRQPEMNVAESWAKEEKMTLEERRKRYHCHKFVVDKDIPTWHTLSKSLSDSDLEPEENTGYAVREDLNDKIALFHGDITTIECDAIVNAANEGCLGGGGVDGCIHRAAGNSLYEECRTLHGCPTGQTKITRGYDLPAKYVLHSVGPIGEDPRALQSCYETCLQLVLKHNIKTVAFCGISTGIFGYPLYPASRIALKVIRNWLETNDNKDKVDKIIICTFLPKEKVCYYNLIKSYFPVAKKQSAAESKSTESDSNSSLKNSTEAPATNLSSSSTTPIESKTEAESPAQESKAEAETKEAEKSDDAPQPQQPAVEATPETPSASAEAESK